ncbi:MAG TPA: hypothetical protein PK788_04600, partial [Gemmatimonadaceae bacterium]|nr:hypothetical protein [Gemmatimonadaceae bacterium]
MLASNTLPPRSRHTACVAAVAVLLGACADGSTGPTVRTAEQLNFILQPVAGVRDSALSSAVSVVIGDRDGVRVETAVDAVTILLGTNPAGATLEGTLTVNAVAGIATFTDVSLDAV